MAAEKEGMSVIDLVPVIIFVVTGIVWIAAAVQNHRLLYLFRRRFPMDANLHIPQTGLRNPRLVSFFIKEEFKPLLQRDSQIWLVRQQFVVLCYLSFGVPIVGMLLLAIIAISDIRPGRGQAVNYNFADNDLRSLAWSFQSL